jgi:hypothetical protein
VLSDTSSAVSASWLLSLGGQTLERCWRWQIYAWHTSVTGVFLSPNGQGFPQIVAVPRQPNSKRLEPCEGAKEVATLLLLFLTLSSGILQGHIQHGKTAHFRWCNLAGEETKIG